MNNSNTDSAEMMATIKFLLRILSYPNRIVSMVSTKDRTVFYDELSSIEYIIDKVVTSDFLTAVYIKLREVVKSNSNNFLELTMNTVYRDDHLSHVRFGIAHKSGNVIKIPE